MIHIIWSLSHRLCHEGYITIIIQIILKFCCSEFLAIQAIAKDFMMPQFKLFSKMLKIHLDKPFYESRHF